MLISVLGVSGLGHVAGLASDDPAALLEVVGSTAAEHVLLLTPAHGVLDAREQAHVLLAANRDVRVCVLPLPHHALTLALVADEVLRRPDASHADPTAVWQLVRQGAARSRSLVWHPRLAQVADHPRSAGELLSDLVRARGWFSELVAGESCVTPGRRGLRTPPGASVLHQGEAPRLLRAQLGDLRPVPVMVDVAPAPYRGRHAVEVTVLVPPLLPPVPLPPCDSCGAGLALDQCPFCGQGPARDLLRPVIPLPTAAVLRPVTDLVVAGSTSHQPTTHPSTYPTTHPTTTRDEVA